MPQSEVPDTRIRYEHEFTFKYQNFKVAAELYQLDINNERHVFGDFSLEQLRAADWEAGDIETQGDTTPFLAPEEMREVLILSERTAVPFSLVGHRLRPGIRDGLRSLMRGMIRYYRVIAEEGESPEALDRRRMNAANFGFNVTHDQMYNQINDWAVGVLNSFFEGWTCPDGFGSCSQLHLTTEEHVEIFTGDLVRARFQQIVDVMDDNGYRTSISASSYPLDAEELGTVDHYIQQEGLTGCSQCYIWIPDHLTVFVEGYESVCPDCEDNFTLCESCGSRCHYNELTEIIQYDEDYDEDHLIEACRRCAREYQRNGNMPLNLNNYSYKPDPIFHTFGDDDVSVPMMGMELEVARERNADSQHVNRWIADAQEDGFLYCKSDSSVQAGLEVVTHPFTYEWAIRNFPFDMFEKLLKIPSILARHESTGTHIHISKSNFDSAHLWKFIKFHLDCDEFAGLIGERGASANFGSLKRDKEKLQKNLKNIGQTKGKQGYMLGLSRSVGINLIPENTIELRYFAGNIQPQGIRKNIEWVKAVYDFTDMVSVTNVQKGALKDPGYFLGFLEDREYTSLSNFLTQVVPTPKKLEE